MGTSSCFHVTQVEEIKRIVGEAMYENEVVGPDGSPVSGGGTSNTLARPRFIIFGDSITQYASETINITSLTQSGGVATAVCASAHGMWPGAIASIGSAANGVNAAYVGAAAVASVPTATTFTFSVSASAPASSGGTPYLIRTANANTGNNSYWNWAQAISKHRAELVANLGVAGDTTTSLIARLSSIDTVSDLAGTEPTDIFVFVGVNDVNTGASAATIKANLRTIYDYVLERDLKLHAATILGSAIFTAEQSAIVNDVNNWIRTEAASDPRIYIYDLYQVTVDPTSTLGNPAAATMTGNVHPKPYYCRLLGQYISDRWDKIYPPYLGLLPASAGDSVDASATVSRQVIKNPTMLGTSGTIASGATGTAPTAWSEYKAATVTLASSVVARSAGTDGDAAGNNTQLVMSTSTGGETTNLYQNTFSANLSAGDIVVAMASLGISSNTNLAGVQLYLTITVDGIAYTSLCGLTQAPGLSILEDGLSFSGYVLETQPLKIPPGTLSAAAIYMQTVFAAASAGSATIKWGRCGLRRL